MIVEFTKIENGLRWDGIDRHFTYTYLPLGYEIQGDDIGQIELDNQIFILCSNDSTIDGISFDIITDEIEYIYN